MKAIWNDIVLADSANTVVMEGNHYFPPDSIRWDLFEATKTETLCSWKGSASYYSVVLVDAKNRDAGWIYKDPKDAAAEIKDHMAFWQGVEIVQ
jgi:uncharacterized protein (DUF427 family)